VEALCSAAVRSDFFVVVVTQFLLVKILMKYSVRKKNAHTHTHYNRKITTIYVQRLETYTYQTKSKCQTELSKI
jgi:hypothetical protein